MESNFQGWLTSTAALVVAVTALLTGLVPLIKAIKDLIPERRDIKGQSVDIKAQPLTVAARRNRWPLLVGSILVLVAASIMGGRYLIRQTLPLNAQCSTAAWELFGRNEWDKAIEKASECIDQFGVTATYLQKTLDDDKSPAPAIGEVSESEKRTLLSRGPLNDVAACWFVKARAEEKLRRKEPAISSYRALAALTYARIYDPAGFFWAPAPLASARLRSLQGTPDEKPNF